MKKSAFWILRREKSGKDFLNCGRQINNQTFCSSGERGVWQNAPGCIRYRTTIERELNGPRNSMDLTTESGRYSKLNSPGLKGLGLAKFAVDPSPLVWYFIFHVFSCSWFQMHRGHMSHRSAYLLSANDLPESTFLLDSSTLMTHKNE